LDGQTNSENGNDRDLRWFPNQTESIVTTRTVTTIDSLGDRHTFQSPTSGTAWTEVTTSTPAAITTVVEQPPVHVIEQPAFEIVSQPVQTFIPAPTVQRTRRVRPIRSYSTSAFNFAPSFSSGAGAACFS
jgi:hypothetical protein